MRRRARRCVLGTVVLLAVLSPTPALAGGPLGWLVKPPCHGPAPSYGARWNRSAAVPPGRQPYYAANVPEYPTLKGGTPIPTYNWGYFGAQYRPQIVGDHPYYRDYRGWSYRIGD